MLSPTELERFKVSKEELAKLSVGFNSEALPLLKNLYNTSFWILLNKKSSRKIIIKTFFEAIDNCNVTKNEADWQSWIYRIWIKEIFDFYLTKENDTKTTFDFIDHTKIEIQDVISFKESQQHKSSFAESELTKSLEKLPAVLRIPMIMKEKYFFDYEKISELIDVPVGVIATRIYRARKLFYLSFNKSFHYEEEKRNWEVGKSTKVIFELRKCALMVDDELTSEQKSAFQDSFKNNGRYQAEILIQQEVKNLFNNRSSDEALTRRIKSKIERKADKKFNQ